MTALSLQKSGPGQLRQQNTMVVYKICPKYYEAFLSSSVHILCNPQIFKRIIHFGLDREEFLIPLFLPNFVVTHSTESKQQYLLISGIHKYETG